MTATHTPGPWVADEWHYVRCDAGPLPRQYVPVVANANIESRWTDEEKGANARLIAAAPELLAALKSLMAWCAGDVLDNPEVNAARAAIAKATQP